EKVRVALIRKKEDIALAAELRDAAEFVIVENGATGVVRRVHDDHARTRRERMREELRGQSESIRFLRRQEDWIRIHKTRDVSKRHPIRRRDNDVIAFIDDG